LKCLAGCAGIDFALERFDDFGEGLGAEVAFAAMADGDGAGFGFLRADDEHVGIFCICASRILRAIFRCGLEVNAQLWRFSVFGDVLGVVGHFFADRADLNLHRREPKRKSASVVFDQDAEEALDGASSAR